MQMTWVGAPTIYYGDEAGVCGFTDPDNRRTYPWGKEDKDLIRFYKEMIAIHKKYPVLIDGSLLELYHDYNLLAYGRFNIKEQIVVVLNNRNEKVHVEIPVWLTGMKRSEETEMVEIFRTDALSFRRQEGVHEVKAGILEMDLLPLSAVILHREETAQLEESSSYRYDSRRKEE